MEGIKHFYKEDPKLTDYYMPPIITDEKGLIETGDAVIFFNYRTDRTRQLTEVFVDPSHKEVGREIGDVKFVCMGPYSDIAPVVYTTPEITNNLADVLAKNKVPELRVAETEKYAHVTFFFNSQVEAPKKLEDRILVPSPKCSSYAEMPGMSAPGVTEKVVEALGKGKHRVIIVNFANADLVGHSGSLPATIKAVEALDEAAGKLYAAAMANGYTLMLTADHGNADDMLYPDGSQKPAHSANPVIFLAADPEGRIKKVSDGGLADVAPTVLKWLGLKKPPEMTGVALI
jgi:2,3-bisphosphoglycerate-independent phosphoglycerate mutase